MFLLSGDARYVDVLERTLYNAALAGVSLQGNTFFYPNPLESDGRYAFNQGALTRQAMVRLLVLPDELARFIPSIPDYIYACRGRGLVRQPVRGEPRGSVVGGARVGGAADRRLPMGRTRSR